MYKGMALKWGKGKSTMALIALFFLNATMMENMCIIPIYNTLYEIFPGQTFAVSTFISLPLAMTIVLALIVPLALKKYEPRTVLVVAVILGAAGTVCGDLVANIWYMVFCRFLCGIAYSCINVTYTVIIADIFWDTNWRAAFMGVFNTVMSGFGAVMSAVGGVMAVNNWHGAFRAYLFFTLPMMILGILFLPSKKAIDWSKHQRDMENTAAEAEKSAVDKKSYPLGSRFILLMVSFALFSLGYSAWMCFQSTYVAQNNLGTTAFTGTLLSLNTFASAITSALFVAIYRKLKGKTGCLACFGMFLSVALLLVMVSRGMTVFASILNGASYGLMWCHIYQYSSELVPRQRLGDACGIATCISCSGYVGGSYLYPFLQETFTGGAINPLYWLASGFCIIAVIIEFIAKDPLKAAAKNA